MAVVRRNMEVNHMYIPCMLCRARSWLFKYVAQNEQYQNKETGILIKKNNYNVRNSAEIKMHANQISSLFYI